MHHSQTGVEQNPIQLNTIDGGVENNHLTLAAVVCYRARWFGSHVGLNVAILLWGSYTPITYNRAD